MRQPLVIAHRGASGSAPENTLLAYLLAFELGAHMFELDVQETTDGHLVCIHDYEIDRTTNGQGAVSDMTLTELKSFDAGSGEKIPLLSEALDMARGRIKVNIELKVLDVEARVLELIRTRKMQHEVVISSFFHDTLSVVRELDTSIPTAALISEEHADFVSLIQNLKANAINPHYDLVTPEFIESAHGNGIGVYAWTVNHQDTMLDMIRFGVDGIITDHPETCLELMRRI